MTEAEGGDTFPYVDYENLYSAIMFWAHDSTPMSFVLSTRNFKLDVQLKRIIEYCGGRTEKNIKNMRPHSAVLVDDDALVWYHHGDVFKISYIKACCTAGRCLNISPFRLNKKSNIVKEGFDYMKIIYYKKYSWDNIPKKYAIEKKTDNTNDSDDEDDDITDDNSKDAAVSDDDDGAGSNKNKKRKKSSTIKHNKHTRIAYTRAEKAAILRYIIDKNEYDRVRGRQMWQEMERRKTCPNRTWQSMKEHFLKTLIYQLDCFDFITAEKKRNLVTQM